MGRAIEAEHLKQRAIVGEGIVTNPAIVFPITREMAEDAPELWEAIKKAYRLVGS
jgi:hypothetical protein